MLRRKPEVFAPTDGVLNVLHESEYSQQVGACFTDPTLYAQLYPLAFKRIRISARDVELAAATGSEITGKVEVRHALELSPDLDVCINGTVCEITRIEDKGRTCWLWLSEIATDGTCDLLSTTYDTDAVGIPHPREGTPTPVYVRKVAPTAKRASGAGFDALGPTLTLRIRATDYANQQRLRRSGITYTVMACEHHGRWVDLTCRERGSDRG